MSNGLERLMRSTMRQNPSESSSFFVSDSIKDLIDSSSLEAKPSAHQPEMQDEIILQIQGISDSRYQLAGWTDSFFIVESPKNHLNRFVNPISKPILATFFERQYDITHTHAHKKDGIWYVTLFFQCDI